MAIRRGRLTHGGGPHIQKAQQVSQGAVSRQLWTGGRQAHCSADDFGLSSREMSVLSLMADGLSDKEIALRIGMSKFTVHKEVGAILGKLEAASRTLAAIRAIKAGLVS